MIAIEKVDQVEVFLNSDGNIVVKQDWMGEESVVIFPVQYTESVIAAIKQVATEASNA